MRQRRWLELIKDYYIEVHYHPGKTNVVVDALSRKAQCNCLIVAPPVYTLCDDLRKLGISIVKEGYLATLTVKSDLYDQIKEAQKKNKGMARIRELMKEGKARCFSIDDQGVLFFGKRIVVQRIITSGELSLMKPTVLNFLFIQTVPKCIKISSKVLVDSHEARNR